MHMKKWLIFILIAASVSMSGCSINVGSPDPTPVPTNSVAYITKYITNTDKLDMREHPSNDASIICSIEAGTPVSFVEDAENGYSMVVYNGITGYALASYLTLEKPEDKNTDTITVTKVIPAAPEIAQSDNMPESASVDKYSDLRSNRTESEIEDYISSYVRPLYEEINDNLDNYSKTSHGNATYWSDNKGYIKKEYPSGTNNFYMTREYYYDTDSGRIAFAFIYDGETEYRLYFRTNQLVRYIAPNGQEINNPASDEALELASRVISEAY